MDFFSKGEANNDRYSIYKSVKNTLDREIIRKGVLLSRIDEEDNDNNIANLHKSIMAIRGLDNSLNKIRGDIVKGLMEFEKFQYSYYTDKSLNRERPSMPQISSDDMEDYLLHFSGNSKGAKVKKTSKIISDLKPSQSDFNNEKIFEMILSGDVPDNKFIVSKDCYIVDGHHRYAALLELDPNQEVQVYQINLPIKELLRRSNLLKITTKSDIDGNKVEKGELEYVFDDWFDKASKKQNKKVEEVMAEFKDGTLNIGRSKKKVNDRKQAIAIALNEAGLSKGGGSRKRYSVGIIRDEIEYDKVLFLLRHPSDGFYPNTWCLPGGTIEDNESPKDAVIREIKEEINKDVKYCYPEGIIKTSKDEMGNSSEIHYYSVTLEKEGEMILDSENSNYSYMSEKEWDNKPLILDLKLHLEKILKYGMTEMKIPKITL